VKLTADYVRVVAESDQRSELNPAGNAKNYWVKWPPYPGKAERVVGWFYATDLDEVLKQQEKDYRHGYTWIAEHELEEQGLTVPPDIPKVDENFKPS